MESLVAMGFAPTDCEAALAKTSAGPRLEGDVEAALNLLLGGFTAAEAQPATTASSSTATRRRDTPQAG